MIITLIQLQILVLILFRLLGLFMQAPVLSSEHLPPLAKVTLAIWVSVLLWFVIPVPVPPSPSAHLFVLALVNELVIGFLIGFVAHVIFTAVQSAGELIDLQMGLSVATTFDPIFGAQISVIGRFALILALTLFVLANGHHMFLSALHQSFKLLPVGVPINLFSGNLVTLLGQTLQNLFLVSIQLSAPTILLLFLTDFAFGIVSRVAPQVNVFMLGFQVKPAVGLLGIFFTLPILFRHIYDLIPQIASNLVTLFAILR